MTPGARVAAAIEVLDDIASGLAAEQALTRWARRSRFAGSKDRAAVRDHVFDVLRQRPLAAHYGQGASGPALMIGLLHLQGADMSDYFTGEGHAPAPLEPTETAFPPPPADRATEWCLPSWLVGKFEAALGDGAGTTARALQARAPVVLRVNLARLSRDAAQVRLHAEGIEARPNPLADAALTVTAGERKIRSCQAYNDGLVELQDAASQAVVETLPRGGRVLDYCAGGGGKALALAMDPTRTVFAHDIDPRRMSDLPPRARRAEAQVELLEAAALQKKAPFDIVLCDAPCSGSGAWRRAPEGKWRLDQTQLDALLQVQDQILDCAAGLVGAGGLLVYATCSVLREENEDRVAAFLQRHPQWRCLLQRRFEVSSEGDGFFVSHLRIVPG